MTTAIDQNEDLVACDIVDLIHARNEQIRHAFASVLAAEGQVRATLLDELVAILAQREAVAQELLGPFVEPQGQVPSDVPTGPAASEVVAGRSLLSSLDVDDDNFDVELIGVARTVTLHIAAKERHDFPLLRGSLPSVELYALAEVLLAAETITRERVTTFRA